MKLKKNLILLVMLISLLAITSFAQKTLEKPFQKWSKDEAMNILKSSAWVQSYQSPEASAVASAITIGREQGQTANSGGNNPRSVARTFGLPPVVIRLHSGLPVRQALARMKEIGAGYDKMDDKQKEDFDKSLQGFLDCAICKNYYVVTITKFIDTSGQYVDEGVFQRMTLEDLKGNVWLVNDKGEKRELVQFNPPKNAADMAVFYFARTENGTPLLTTQSKNLDFVFKNDFLDRRNPYAALLPRHFEFNVSKMVVNGNLLF